MNVPPGQPKIAQPFMAGLNVINIKSSPGGTAENLLPNNRIVRRPPGANSMRAQNPRLKPWACIFHLSEAELTTGHVHLRRAPGGLVLHNFASKNPTWFAFFSAGALPQSVSDPAAFPAVSPSDFLPVIFLKNPFDSLRCST
jgi:hypothetical protein